MKSVPMELTLASAKSGASLADDLLSRPIEFISRHRRTFQISAAALIAAIYIASINSFWWIGTDSGLYLNLARSLQRGEGYSLCGAANGHVPPLFPAFIAGLQMLGLKSYLALNAVMCAIGLATILCSYFLLRCLVHRDWALAITVTTALTLEMLQRSGEILTDVPFMLLLTLAMLLYYRGLGHRAIASDVSQESQALLNQRRWSWVVASILLVVACWIRITGLAIVLGVGLALLLTAWRESRLSRRGILQQWPVMLNLGILLAGVALTLAVFYPAYKAATATYAGSYVNMLERPEWSLYYRLVVNPASSFFGGAGQLSRLLTSQGPGKVDESSTTLLIVCVILFVLPIAIGMARRLRRGDYIAPLAICCYIGTHMMTASIIRTRYFLPIMPLLLVYWLEGVSPALKASLALAKGLSQQKKTSVAGVMALILLGAIAGMNLPKIARLIHTKHASDFYARFENGKWHEEYELAQMLRQRKVHGNILSNQVLSQLADIPAPHLSTRVFSNALAESKLREMLSRFNIELVVIDTDEPNGLASAIGSAIPCDTVLSLGDLRVLRTAMLAEHQPSPAEGSSASAPPAPTTSVIRSDAGVSENTPSARAAED